MLAHTCTHINSPPTCLDACVDLVPREVVTKWVTHLRNEFPTIMFKSSTQSQKSHLSASNAGGAGCYGGDSLLQLLQNYARSHNIKTAITVGVVGTSWAVSLLLHVNLFDARAL